MKIVIVFQCIVVYILLTGLSCAETTNTSVKIDTTFINEITTLPVIDGLGDDDCWKNSAWYGINNVWINYGETIGAKDYYGRYKVVWSKKENLLYFLVEITDDYAIGGYGAGTAAIYNYDIIEVFLDENRSKGLNNVTDPSTGKNIENAFAYHIYADFPKKGEVNKTPVVEDIPGTRNEHFPEFAIRGSGNFYTREFSLKVYDSTYNNSNRELSRVQLKKGKIMGLSLAYCDNDKNDGQRDNFFGSVWVPAAKYNNHWIEADDFGPAKLVSTISDKIVENKLIPKFNLYPNPVSDFLIIKTENVIKEVSIIDIFGKAILRQPLASNKIVSTHSLASGSYFLKITDYDNVVTSSKFIKE
jgi:hypothetical protein